MADDGSKENGSAARPNPYYNPYYRPAQRTGLNDGYGAGRGRGGNGHEDLGGSDDSSDEGDVSSDDGDQPGLGFESRKQRRQNRKLREEERMLGVFAEEDEGDDYGGGRGRERSKPEPNYRKPLAFVSSSSSSSNTKQDEEVSPGKQHRRSDDDADEEEREEDEEEGGRLNADKEEDDEEDQDEDDGFDERPRFGLGARDGGDEGNDDEGRQGLGLGSGLGLGHTGLGLGFQPSSSAAAPSSASSTNAAEKPKPRKPLPAALMFRRFIGASIPPPAPAPPPPSSGTASGEEQRRPQDDEEAMDTEPPQQQQEEAPREEERGQEDDERPRFGLGSSSSSSTSSSSSSASFFAQKMRERAQAAGFGTATGDDGADGSTAAGSSAPVVQASFEKHTKGFASRYLAQFGFKGRLGAKENGIVAPIAVQVRPERLGLGAGGFKEAASLAANKALTRELKSSRDGLGAASTSKPFQAEDESREAEDGDYEETEEAKDGGLALQHKLAAAEKNLERQSATSSSDKRGGKGSKDNKDKKGKKGTVVYKTAAQLLAEDEAEADGVGVGGGGAGGLKIVDMRGPTAKVLSSYKALAGKTSGHADALPPEVEETAEATARTGIGRELLHNLTTLAGLAEVDLHTLHRKLKSSSSAASSSSASAAANKAKALEAAAAAASARAQQCALLERSVSGLVGGVKAKLKAVSSPLQAAVLLNEACEGYQRLWEACPRLCVEPLQTSQQHRREGENGHGRGGGSSNSSIIAMGSALVHVVLQSACGKWTLADAADCDDTAAEESNGVDNAQSQSQHQAQTHNKANRAMRILDEDDDGDDDDGNTTTGGLRGDSRASTGHSNAVSATSSSSKEALLTAARKLASSSSRRDGGGDDGSNDGDETPRAFEHLASHDPSSFALIAATHRWSHLVSRLPVAVGTALLLGPSLRSSGSRRKRRQQQQGENDEGADDLTLPHVFEQLSVSEKAARGWQTDANGRTEALAAISHHAASQLHTTTTAASSLSSAAQAKLRSLEELYGSSSVSSSSSSSSSSSAPAAPMRPSSLPPHWSPEAAAVERLVRSVVRKRLRAVRKQKRTLAGREAALAASALSVSLATSSALEKSLEDEAAGLILLLRQLQPITAAPADSVNNDDEVDDDDTASTASSVIFDEGDENDDRAGDNDEDDHLFRQDGKRIGLFGTVYEDENGSGTRGRGSGVKGGGGGQGKRRYRVPKAAQDGGEQEEEDAEGRSLSYREARDVIERACEAAAMSNSHSSSSQRYRQSSNKRPHQQQPQHGKQDEDSEVALDAPSSQIALQLIERAVSQSAAALFRLSQVVEATVVLRLRSMPWSPLEQGATMAALVACILPLLPSLQPLQPQRSRAASPPSPLRFVLEGALHQRLEKAVQEDEKPFSSWVLPWWSLCGGKEAEPFCGGFLGELASTVASRFSDLCAAKAPNTSAGTGALVQWNSKDSSLLEAIAPFVPVLRRHKSSASNDGVSLLDELLMKSVIPRLVAVARVELVIEPAGSPISSALPLQQQQQASNTGVQALSWLLAWKSVLSPLQLSCLLEGCFAVPWSRALVQGLVALFGGEGEEDDDGGIAAFQARLLSIGHWYARWRRVLLVASPSLPFDVASADGSLQRHLGRGLDLISEIMAAGEELISTQAAMAGSEKGSLLPSLKRKLAARLQSSTTAAAITAEADELAATLAGARSGASAAADAFSWALSRRKASLAQQQRSALRYGSGAAVVREPLSAPAPKSAPPKAAAVVSSVVGLSFRDLFEQAAAARGLTLLPSLKRGKIDGAHQVLLLSSSSSSASSSTTKASSNGPAVSVYMAGGVVFLEAYDSSNNSNKSDVRVSDVKPVVAWAGGGSGSGGGSGAPVVWLPWSLSDALDVAVRVTGAVPPPPPAPAPGPAAVPTAVPAPAPAPGLGPAAKRFKAFDEDDGGKGGKGANYSKPGGHSNGTDGGGMRGKRWNDDDNDGDAE